MTPPMRQPMTGTEALLLLLNGPEEPGWRRRFHGRLRVEVETGLWDLPPFASRRLTSDDIDRWTPYTADDLDVTVDGSALRVALADGPVATIADASHVWTFEQDGQAHEVPLVTGRSGKPVLEAPLRWIVEGVGTDFLAGRETVEVVGPVRFEEHLGRPSWELELRRGKVELLVAVDIATGLILNLAYEGFRVHWTALDVDPEPSELRWDGPVRTEEDERRRHEVVRQGRREADLEFWAREVGPLQLRVVVTTTLDLTPREVTVHDPETGTFEAVLNAAPGSFVRLSRRLPGTGRASSDADAFEHHWSTSRFDWSITGLPVELTDAGRAAIERSLPVD